MSVSNDELTAVSRLCSFSGLSSVPAEITELTAHDALGAHAESELGIDPDDIVNPWHAALASAVSFTVGAILPLIAILAAGPAARVPVTVGAVLVALAGAGAASARLGGSPWRSAVVRILIGSAAGLLFTYAIGHLIGGAVR